MTEQNLRHVHVPMIEDVGMKDKTPEDAMHVDRVFLNRLFELDDHFKNGRISESTHDQEIERTKQMIGKDQHLSKIIDQLHQKQDEIVSENPDVIYVNPDDTASSEALRLRQVITGLIDTMSPEMKVLPTIRAMKSTVDSLAHRVLGLEAAQVKVKRRLATEDYLRDNRFQEVYNGIVEADIHCSTKKHRIEAAKTHPTTEGWNYTALPPNIEGDVRIRFYEAVTLEGLLNVTVTAGFSIEPNYHADEVTGKTYQTISVQYDRDCLFVVDQRLRRISASSIICWREALAADVMNEGGKYSVSEGHMNQMITEFLALVKQSRQQQQERESALILPESAKGKLIV